MIERTNRTLQPIDEQAVLRLAGQRKGRGSPHLAGGNRPTRSSTASPRRSRSVSVKGKWRKAKCTLSPNSPSTRWIARYASREYGHS